MNSPESLLFAIQVIVGVVVTCGVPWAFVMERRLARIEARLTNGLSSRMDEIRRRLDHHSDQANKLHGQIENVEKEQIVMRHKIQSLEAGRAK